MIDSDFKIDTVTKKITFKYDKYNKGITAYDMYEYMKGVWEDEMGIDLFSEIIKLSGVIE